MRTRSGLLLLALVLGLVAGPFSTSQAGPVRPLVIEVLSNRADLVTAGDALVAVRLPQQVDAGAVTVRVGDRDVTESFRVRADGRFLGLVEGLEVGSNVVRAEAPGHEGSTVIRNHPNGGPVFTGPQLGPYRCQKTAVDAWCNEPATYTWLYRSTDPSTPDLQPYDRENPPEDVATTTTDEGVEVPFIVRREDGYQDRDRYTILALFQEGQDWKPWQQQEQWNNKLLIPHGGNCGASYAPGNPPLQDYSGTLESVPGVTPSYVTALGRGFAVLSTALANTGHNCNVAMEAESLMMAKEHLVETYGELRYTIGTGCSGGSITQHTVANAYPGIYQGLVTTCSYPDTLTAGAQFADYHLMRLYFEDPSRWGRGVAWSPSQMAQVEGHASHVNAVAADELLFKAALDPEHSCSGTGDPVADDPSTRYDSEINPAGVRCSVLDIMVNLLGPRARNVWSEQERAAGRGFAGIPFANTGVQFGLNAVNTGQITPAQFVDLNEKIGGLNVDSEFVPERIEGDPAAIKRVYRTGLINEATNLGEVAIINHGGPDPGAAHDYSHAFWTEERLLAKQGHTDNRVMWFGPAPLIGDARWANEALLAMDRWLTNVEEDETDRPLAEKVVTDKPADVTDRCVVSDLAPGCSVRELQALQTRFSTPRQEAGGPPANDNVACTLQPLDRSDYVLGALFTADEWSRLEAVFPDGVCDYSVPGRGQRPDGAETWLRYGSPGSTNVYGGRNLPRVPPHSGDGWASPSFHELLQK